MDGTAAVTADPELEPVQLICDGQVQRMSEAGRTYIYMAKLKFYVHGTARVLDALLCIDYPNADYPTKLYLAENLGLGLNWNENAFILGRQWFSWSWKGVLRNQKPIEILAGHLEAFR